MTNQFHRAAIAAPFSAEARGLFQHVLTPAPGQTLASLATLSSGLWVVAPSVVSGMLIDVTDATDIPAAALLAIAAVTGVQVTASNASGINGSVSEITDLRANTNIVTPSGAVTTLSDTAAHLGTYTNGWSINPLVAAGMHVEVLDSGEVSSNFLRSLYSSVTGTGHIAVPNATAFKGEYTYMNFLYDAMDAGTISIPPRLQLTVTDSYVEAYYVASLADHAGVTVIFDNPIRLAGGLDDILAVFSNPWVFDNADFQTVALYSLSVAQLVTANAQIAQYTDALIEASLFDSLSNLVSQDVGTGVWSIKSGAESASSFQISGASVTAAAGAVLALIDGGKPVYAGAVSKFTGSVTEIKQLLATSVSLSQYGLALSDTTVTAADLYTLGARAQGNVEATAVTKLSGSLGELSSVLNDSTIVLSHNEKIDITSALTVAELAIQRTSLAVKTDGVITGALADSIANLTGHLAEAGANGYTVVDTVLNVLAGGAIVDGAHGVTIIAGGPTTMSAADVLALVAQVGDGALLDLTSVTSFSGSAVQIKEMLDAGVKTDQFGVTLSDTTVTTATLLELGEVVSGSVAASAATSVSGSHDDLLTVLLGGHYVLSGTEAISVTTGLTLDELATFKALASTTGIVSAVLRGSVAELTGHAADGGGIGYIVRDSVVNLLAGGAIIEGAQAIELSSDPVPDTMTAVDALALVDLLDGGHLDLNGVYLFTGSVSDMLRLYDADLSTGYFSVDLTDATITVADLQEIAQRADGQVRLAEASHISATLSELNELRNEYIDWSSAAINVTSPVTVTALAALRSYYGNNLVTGALADSIANLTGHTAEAGDNGYTVVDTVAHVLAGGAIVSGALGVHLADSIVNLTGHTTAGDATSYSVIDTVAALSASNGAITSHAQAVTVRDTIAHLTGHTNAGGATGYIVADGLEHIIDAADSGLVGPSTSLTLTDLTLDVARLEVAWDSEAINYSRQIDATGVQSISGDGYSVDSVFNNTAVQFSGAEQVTLLNDQADVWLANRIDALTTGVVTASIAATAQQLLTLTGTNNHYDLTVTDAVSVSQLKALDAITTGTVSYDTVVDSASSLIKLVGNTWTVDSQLHANTDIIVIGEIAAGALQALRAFNIDGDVTQASPAANHFSIATSAVADYTIAAGEVTNLIDVAGDQVYHVAQSSGATSGGVLNLSGVDGHNTIVFDGYYMYNNNSEGSPPPPHLTMTQSGTTAYFLDAETHMQVAAISLSVDSAGQYINYADAQFEIKLVGTVDPVIQIYGND
jgi:hypothetical protein